MRRDEQIWRQMREERRSHQPLATKKKRKRKKLNKFTASLKYNGTNLVSTVRGMSQGKINSFSFGISGLLQESDRHCTDRCLISSLSSTQWSKNTCAAVG